MLLYFSKIIFLSEQCTIWAEIDHIFFCAADKKQKNNNKKLATKYSIFKCHPKNTAVHQRLITLLYVKSHPSLNIFKIPLSVTVYAKKKTTIIEMSLSIYQLLISYGKMEVICMTIVPFPFSVVFGSLKNHHFERTVDRNKFHHVITFLRTTVKFEIPCSQGKCEENSFQNLS